LHHDKGPACATARSSHSRLRTVLRIRVLLRTLPYLPAAVRLSLFERERAWEKPLSLSSALCSVEGGRTAEPSHTAVDPNSDQSHGRTCCLAVGTTLRSSLQEHPPGRTRAARGDSKVLVLRTVVGAGDRGGAKYYALRTALYLIVTPYTQLIIDNTYCSAISFFFFSLKKLPSV